MQLPSQHLRIALLWLAWLAATPAASTTLYLTTETDDGCLRITGRLGDREVVHAVSEPVSAQLLGSPGLPGNVPVQDVLEADGIASDRILARLAGLGDAVLSPFAELVDDAQQIEVRVQGSTLQVPLESFFLHGEPLFLHRPLVFTFEDHGPSPYDFSRARAGLGISDVTADPGRAVAVLPHLFPGSRFLDIAEVSPRKLRDAGGTDLLLISAHGAVRTRAPDYIQLADGQRLSAELAASLRPRMVYFDSCQLGISREFLHAFREAGTAFYLAPILNNEAGDSSTHTIELFFGDLRRGVDPVHALFNTRRALWQLYRGQALRFRLWRAFPFRVYRLN